MFTAILSAIPLWVFPLLFGLIWLGTRAARDRTVSPWLVYTLPLLGLLSLFRALGLTEAEIALMALFLSYLAGTGLGYWIQPRWIVARSAGRGPRRDDRRDGGVSTHPARRRVALDGRRVGRRAGKRLGLGAVEFPRRLRRGRCPWGR